MVEFSGEKELHPFCQVIGTKDVKICLKFLIGSLGLTISLRVIGSGEVNIILKEMSEFFGKGRSKLRTMIRDESIVQSKSFEDKVKKQLGDSCSIDSCRARSEDYPLHKAMVDHDHDRIES